MSACHGGRQKGREAEREQESEEGSRAKERKEKFHCEVRNKGVKKKTEFKEIICLLNISTWNLP